LAKKGDGVKILVVHNSYGMHSGEETVVYDSIELLRSKGHEVSTFARSSAEIAQMRFGRILAFFSGILNAKARCQFRGLLHKARPDIVHIHNLFPLISPAILPECSKAGIPVVMTVHNYRLLCPNGLQMPKGRTGLCRRCLGGREYWCVLKNCESSLPRSFGYAIRNCVARRWRLFRDHVWLYICLSNPQRQALIEAGYPAERVEVLENMVQPALAPGSARLGRYVGFAGRLSPEKGIDILLAAARCCQQIPIRIAGSLDTRPEIVHQAPANCRFWDAIQKSEMPRFYRSCRFLVVPSLCQETFCLAAAEAQVQARPVICSRIGALPEIVVDGITGLLFEPGDAIGLAKKMEYLWQRPELSISMGLAGQRRALSQYSPQRYYDRLMYLYRKAMALGLPTLAKRDQKEPGIEGAHHVANHLACD
jgi:glycosyltransferase involved in cell wall biosynthesis